MRTGKWAALGAVLATASTVSLAFGEDPTPCYEEYWASGLAQQVCYDEFRGLHGGGPCAAEDPSTEAAQAGPQDLRGGTQE